MRSSTHRRRRLPLLHVVDAALSDAFIIKFRLAAISAVVVQTTKAVFSEANTGGSTHSLLICNGVGDAQRLELDVSTLGGRAQHQVTDQEVEVDLLFALMDKINDFISDEL